MDEYRTTAEPEFGADVEATCVRCGNHSWLSGRNTESWLRQLIEHGMSPCCGAGIKANPGWDKPEIATTHARRQAISRINPTRSQFEALMDAVYEHIHHNPGTSLVGLFRSVFHQSMNIDDHHALERIKKLTEEARKAKLLAAINKIGFDKVEEMLLKKAADAGDDPLEPF